MAGKIPRKPIEDYQELSPNIRAALAEAMKSLNAKGNISAAERLGDAVDRTVNKKRVDPSMIGTIGLAYIKELELYPNAELEKYLPMMLGDEKKAAMLIKLLRDVGASREQARPDIGSFMERILMPRKIEAMESATLIRNDGTYRAVLEEIRKAIDHAVSDSFCPTAHMLPKNRKGTALYI